VPCTGSRGCAQWKAPCECHRGRRRLPWAHASERSKQVHCVPAQASLPRAARPACHARARRHKVHPSSFACLSRRQRRCCARRLRAAALPGAPAARAPCRPRPGPIPRCRSCRLTAAARARVAQRRGAQQRGGCRAGTGVAAARRRGRRSAGRGARAHGALERRGGRWRKAAGGARCAGAGCGGGGRRRAAPPGGRPAAGAGAGAATAVACAAAPRGAEGLPPHLLHAGCLCGARPYSYPTLIACRP